MGLKGFDGGWSDVLRGDCCLLERLGKESEEVMGIRNIVGNGRRTQFF